MTNRISIGRDRVGLLSVTACFASLGLTACVYPDAGRSSGYREGPPVQATAVVMVQDDYVYYPQYEVYYSSSRHQYGYRDGNAWAWRPAPPQVSLNVLVASPSVRMDFHDSPDRHHGTVVKQYPKNWKPPSSDHGGKTSPANDKNNDHKDGDRSH